MGRLEEKERGIFSTIFGWLVYILILIGLTYLIITYVGQRTRVSGHSMETTLSDGDNLIVDKLSYRFKDPKRYIYGAEIMDSPGIAAEPITLGEDEYFVLGDNRNHSSDSRDPSVGILHREDLIGKAWVRIYPFDKMGVIRHE